MVREGKTDQEIYDFFTARYGEWVLLKPTSGGLNMLLWVAPGALLVVGLGFIFSMLRKRGSQAAPAAAATVEPAALPSADDDYLARIRKDLKS